MPAATAESLTAANAAGKPLLGSVCHTAVMLAELPAHAHAAVTAALLNPAVKSTDIVRVLLKHGLPARAENVNRHRRRLTGGSYACKCPLPREATS